MTDLEWPPVDADPTAIETPRLHQHVYARTISEVQRWGVPIGRCRYCERTLDEATVRRGKSARARGNAFEREVAARLGAKRVGQYGGSADVEGDWIAVQCKVGGYYPALIDRWLRAIPVRADQLRAVVIGDAPGSAGKRRSLIVLDLDDFIAWYGKP